MNATHKKKIAGLLLDLLLSKGLNIYKWGCGTVACRKEVPVVVEDFQQATDLLERLGYDFVTTRRLQDAPKDPSKVNLKMIRRPMDEPREIENVVWVRLPKDIALKALVLGFIPETISAQG